MEGCLRSKVIYPFLTMYKKIKMDILTGRIIDLHRDTLERNLFKLFLEFEPKEHLRKQLEKYARKEKNVYYDMYRKYEGVPFNDEEEIDVVSSHVDIS